MWEGCLHHLVEELVAHDAGHQELRAVQVVQFDGADARELNAEVSVLAGALNAYEDPQVDGQPLWVWAGQRGRDTCHAVLSLRGSEPVSEGCASPVLRWQSSEVRHISLHFIPAAPQSQHALLPGSLWMVLMMPLTTDRKYMCSALVPLSTVASRRNVFCCTKDSRAVMINSEHRLSG